MRDELTWWNENVVDADGLLPLPGILVL